MDSDSRQAVPGKRRTQKFVQHKGRRAYVTVNTISGEDIPGSMDEPVRVCVFDLRSGDELDSGQDFASLRCYLESLQG